MLRKLKYSEILFLYQQTDKNANSYNFFCSPGCRKLELKYIVGENEIVQPLKMGKFSNN